ncbi:hypothetical protein B0H13DRAFT_2240081 [Mycena leptocephala]|nr:hypothetical protein B0H13DRAFT_2240081 [Mycena leptocephala]
MSYRVPPPSEPYSDFPIDPALMGNSLEPPRVAETNATNIMSLSQANLPATLNTSNVVRDTYKRKEPLQAECDKYSVHWAKKDSLARLRGLLIDHWWVHNIGRYPSATPATPPAKKTRRKNKTPATVESTEASEAPSRGAEEGVQISDADLLAEFNVAGTASEELLGYDEENDDDDEEIEDLKDNDVYADFQKQTRIDAAARFEGNRRAGGLKTQKSMVKDWNAWVAGALTRGEVRDTIVDEHSLLLFIKYSAERPKRNRRGVGIPGTRIGASQIKKLFFGVLRVRKTQEAANPKLKSERPCTTVLVYDETKTRMDQACERERSGMIEAEQDAPDIIANTFLAQVTAEQLKTIGYSFLEHRECAFMLKTRKVHQVINGHLAWICQNASGNRGDDFRALKLCEMQPYVFLHPNKETSVYCVLGLQGEEKAGKKGMKTVINPSYTTWIAHRNPEMCPLGAMAIYHHWLHDEYDLTDKRSIDWAVNKSWRNIRLLFGSDPTVPYNENSLYNLYCWSRGTYMDTYAPALPKVAILGTHGYKAHENYDPVWRHVRVPESFLCLMCPKAEEILEKIEGV